MILRNVLSQFFIVKCFSKSLLVRILKIVIGFSPSLPPFSVFMGPVHPSVQNPGKNTEYNADIAKKRKGRDIVTEK